MSDPQATLSIFAEVAIALSGFSGIVIAFGRRSLGSLSNLELRRLSNLFVLSGLVLLSSLLAIALLHAEFIDQIMLWRGSSLLVFLIATPWLFVDAIKVKRLEVAERSKVNTRLLYAFNIIGVGTLLLLLVNCLYIGKAWPFFLALVVAIMGAFQQFVLLVRTGLRDD